MEFGAKAAAAVRFTSQEEAPCTVVAGTTKCAYFQKFQEGVGQSPPRMFECVWEVHLELVDGVLSQQDADGRSEVICFYLGDAAAAASPGISRFSQQNQCSKFMGHHPEPASVTVTACLAVSRSGKQSLLPLLLTAGIWLSFSCHDCDCCAPFVIASCGLSVFFRHYPYWIQHMYIHH